MKNYNRETRKNIQRLYNQLINFNLPSDLAVECILKYLTTINDKGIQVFRSMMYMTGYTNLYIKLKNKKQEIGLTKDEKLTFTMLNNVKDRKTLSNLMIQNPKILVDSIFSMIEFNRSTVLKKIKLIKMLDEKEILKLSSINSLFYQELENYNIDITLDFIISKINQGMKNNIENVLIDSAILLKKLLKNNDKDALDILKELMQVDIKLLTYYSNFDGENLSEEEFDKKETKRIRYEKYKSLSVETLIENLNSNDLISLLESYIEYINFSSDEKEEIDKLLNSDINKNLRKKLLSLTEK